jgi:hypothetical protein
MSTFHRTELTRSKSVQSTGIEERLALGQSAVVIIGLSILSWAALISIVMVLRGLL